MSISTTKQCVAKPILKWAGGKTQMLGELLPRVPKKYGKYIEPFFGGGALFFSLNPENAVIADSNPELINMYLQVANNLDEVIDYLRQYQNSIKMDNLIPHTESIRIQRYVMLMCYKVHQKS